MYFCAGTLPSLDLVLELMMTTLYNMYFQYGTMHTLLRNIFITVPHLPIVFILDGRVINEDLELQCNEHVCSYFERETHLLSAATATFISLDSLEYFLAPSQQLFTCYYDDDKNKHTCSTVVMIKERRRRRRRLLLIFNFRSTADLPASSGWQSNQTRNYNTRIKSTTGCQFMLT